MLFYHKFQSIMPLFKDQFLEKISLYFMLNSSTFHFIFEVPVESIEPSEKSSEEENLEVNKNIKILVAEYNQVNQLLIGAYFRKKLVF